MPRISFVHSLAFHSLIRSSDDSFIHLLIHSSSFLPPFIQALKEEEELRAEVEEDEMYYTTEARCRQGGTGGGAGGAGGAKKQGAEFFASLGEGGRGMHAGPAGSGR